MKSKYDLNYVLLGKTNLNLAYEVQKNTWPKDPDYENLFDKAINTKDDNCFFLVYANEN